MVFHSSKFQGTIPTCWKLVCMYAPQKSLHGDDRNITSTCLRRAEWKLVWNKVIAPRGYSLWQLHGWTGISLVAAHPRNVLCNQDAERPALESRGTFGPWINYDITTIWLVSHLYWNNLYIKCTLGESQMYSNKLLAHYYHVNISPRWRIAF